MRTPTPLLLCRLRSIAAHRDHFVRRLSVCACVRACVCLSDSHTFLIVTLVNTIETKPLHISLSNLQDMLTLMRGCTLLILEVRGQRSKVTLDIYGNKLVNTIET